MRGPGDDGEPGYPGPANPRAIQAPHDVAHNIAGPYLRPATTRLHEIWNTFTTVFYTSGATPDDMDAWINSFANADGEFKPKWAGSKYVATDFSAYDCAHSTLSFRYAESLYASWGLDTPELSRVLAAWRQPTGRTCRGGRYRAQVMNGSGRDDTSMLNVLLNGSAQYWAWSITLLGHPPCDAVADELAWLDTVLRIAVMGDDSLTVVPALDYRGRPWVEATYTAALECLGFEVKLLTSTNAWEVVYLGCRPYPVEGGLAWGPTLGRRLYKHHSMVWPSKADPYAWLKGVVRAEAGLYSFVPFLAPIAERCLVVLQHHTETPVVANDWKWVEHRRAHTPAAQPELAAKMLTRVYGITPGQYADFLVRLEAVTTLPWRLDCEAIDRVLEVDDL